MQVLIEGCQEAGMSDNLDPVARQLWFALIARTGVLGSSFAR